MKNKGMLVFLIIIATTFSVQHTYASSAADLDYGIMIEKADFIVVGDVTRVHNYTFTYVSIAISEFMTNPLNMSQMTITIGGEAYDGVGGTVYTSHDLFYVGEKVLVFVEKYGPRYWVHEGEAGKYLVLDEWPSYVHTHSTIINGWHTTPDWKPRSVVYAVFKSTGHGTVNLFPIVFTQILFAVLLIPILFVLMKPRRKLL